MKLLQHTESLRKKTCKIKHRIMGKALKCYTESKSKTEVTEQQPEF